MSNNKKLFLYQIISLILSSILGILFHFTYNLSGNNKIIALFSAVNESTWEHLKLIFFPMLIPTILGYIFLKDNFSNFLCVRTIAIISAMLFTIIFFYTYTGILGKNIAFVDISSFFISILIGEYITDLLINNKIKCNKTIAIAFLFFILILFVIFTFNPPKIQLFKDPITSSYGIFKLFFYICENFGSSIF